MLRPTGTGHSLPRLFRCYGSCAQLLTWRAPAHVLQYGHIAAANVSLCRLRFIICAESALVFFLLQLCLTGSSDGLVGLRQSADVVAGELG